MDKNSHPDNMLEAGIILKMFLPDKLIAIVRFKEFNEKINNDKCLDERVKEKRLSDEEARQEIKKLLGEIEIAHVKSLPKQKRNEILRKVKKLEGLSLRQAARIFGISLSLVFKA